MDVAAPKSPHEVAIDKPLEIFGECRDCGRVFYSAKEFSGHFRNSDGKCT